MLIDIIIFMLLVSAVFRGHDIGLVRQLLSAGGFIAGLFAGAALQPWFVNEADNPLTQAIVSLGLALTGALLLLSAGELLGVFLKRKLQPVMRLDRADAYLGSLAGGASLLIAVWLLHPLLINLPEASLQDSLRESRIVRLVDDSLPPAPGVIATLDRIINPNGFPDVFAGLEREPVDDGTPLPPLGDLTSAVEQARASVVKLEGRGCGGIVEGSGWIARKDGNSSIVVTNAHVIAGVSRPTVIDAAGEHTATPIWFNEDMDMAVLRVNGLAGDALTAGARSVPDGTPAAVLGYPGGGAFRASSASVLDHFYATGRDIYGQDRTTRDIYELKADIIPGNSGGPLIAADGSVIGLIFAESTSYENIGYAITMGPVIDNLSQAASRNTPVGTGACAE